MAPKPQSKHFSFRRFLGRRIESANASSNPPRSEGVSSQSSSGSISPAQVQPSTVVGVTGVAIVDEPPPPHSLDNPSFFANSSHFVVQNMKVVDASQHHASNSAGEGWKQLLEKVAPAALHDSEARYDPPKCDEDTRVEVISELMSWITTTTTADSPNSPSSPQQRLLCMTGAAGSGKSALQQTIAERCASEDPKVLGATFFFSATDQTRNSVSAVIPTIAYQLALRHRPLRQLVAAAVDNDPLIFSKSLRTQMRTLIVDPVDTLRNEGGSTSAGISAPCAILIDGLDECQDEDRQAELLLTIKECFVDSPTTPFRLFVCSRPEWAIRSALKPGGYLHGVAYHIQLSDQYDATADTRRFLRRRILALAPHSDLGGSGPLWFSEDDIERLVEAASGQFVCAATIIRYLSERHASPAKRLNTLLKWISSGSGNIRNPFSTLDILYSKIVTAAKGAYEAALRADSDEGDNFLLLLRAYQLSPLYSPVFGVIPVQDWDMLLCGELNTHEQILSDLRSLMTTVEVKKLSEFGHHVPAPGFRPLALHIYHKSFVDFCGDQSRSKDLYIPYSRVVEYYAECSVRHMSRCPLHDVRYLDSRVWEPWKTGTTQSFHFCIGLLSTLRIPGPLGSSSLKSLLGNDMLEKMDKWLEGVSKAERYFLERWVKFLSRMMDELKDTDPDLFSRAQLYHDVWREEHRRLIHRRRQNSGTFS